MRIILTLLMLLLLLGCVDDRSSDFVASPRVDTSSGLVEGIAKEDVLAFKGIPYAEPPVGAGRFRPSVIKERQEDVILAYDFGPACIQESSWKVPKAGVAEDCLTINVWTPALDGKERPVLVWLHGGGNIGGSGAEPRFDGEAFVRRGDVVLVTFNYRLGFLGFLDLSEMRGDEYHDSANNGLKDQMLALKWVRRNIHAFSGDPGNVTAFGESAGGAALVGLLGTDHPEQLFDRAIIQSRSKLIRHSVAKDVSRIYRQLAAEISVESTEDWMAMDEETVLHLMTKMREHVASGMEMEALHGPTYGEGLVIPMLPEERLRTGHASELEIMIGTTMDESRLWADGDPTLCERDPFHNELTEGNPLLGLAALIMAKVVKLDITGVDPNRKSFTDGQAMLSITDEIFFRIPSFDFADAHVDGGGKTYMYIFEYPVNRPDNCLHNSSPHAVEIPFVFHNLDDAFNLKRIGPARDERDAKARQDLADTTQDAWLSFSRSGDPNVEGAPLGVWPLYDAVNRPTLVLSANPRVANNPFSFERTLLKMFGADELDLFE